MDSALQLDISLSGGAGDDRPALHNRSPSLVGRMEAYFSGHGCEPQFRHQRF